MTVARLPLVGRTENQLQPAVSISATHVPRLPQLCRLEVFRRGWMDPKIQNGSLQKRAAIRERVGLRLKPTLIVLGLAPGMHRTQFGREDSFYAVQVHLFRLQPGSRPAAESVPQPTSR